MATIDWYDGTVISPDGIHSKDGEVAVRGLYAFFREEEGKRVLITGVNAIQVALAEEDAEKIWAGTGNRPSYRGPIMDYLHYMEEPLAFSREEIADSLELETRNEREQCYTALRILANTGEIEAFTPWGDRSKTVFYGLEGCEEQWRVDETKRKMAKSRNKGRKETKD